MVRPRRGRCPACAATQVLLPAELVPRHADTVQVVVSGLLASQSGAGHRRIAADLGVPADTVRTWLRRVTARAGWLYREAVRWAHDLDPLLPAMQPTGSALGNALSAIGHAVMAVRLRLGSTATAWQLIGRIAGGRLLTQRGHPAAETRRAADPHAQITPTPCTRIPMLIRVLLTGNVVSTRQERTPASPSSAS